MNRYKKMSIYKYTKSYITDNTSVVIVGNGPYSFWNGGVYYQNVNWIPVPPIYFYGVR